MGSNHLKSGSSMPPKVEGKLRLYAMEYCPFAQRARLILKVKNVPHDVVMVSLSEKPEWLFDIHPEGKVPALDIGSKIIVESLDIVNYLNDEYPDPPLYPAEPHACELDKELIKKIGPLTSVFYSLVLEQKKHSPEEWLKKFLTHLDVFEANLKARGSTFFGGDKPSMVDYMLWPWTERAGCISLTLGEELPLEPDQLPHICSWKKAMRTQPVIDAMYHGPEPYYKCMRHVIAGTIADYDNL